MSLLVSRGGLSSLTIVVVVARCRWRLFIVVVARRVC